MVQSSWNSTLFSREFHCFNDKFRYNWNEKFGKSFWYFISFAFHEHLQLQFHRPVWKTIWKSPRNLPSLSTQQVPRFYQIHVIIKSVCEVWSTTIENDRILLTHLRTHRFNLIRSLEYRHWQRYIRENTHGLTIPLKCRFSSFKLRQIDSVVNVSVFVLW